MNPTNRTPYHNCDSLKEGITNPVIAALDLSKHRTHPENWNSFKGMKKFSLNYERQSGKIYFLLFIIFLIKQKKQYFSRNYQENVEGGEWCR